jgi:hypothetical protein
MGCNNSPDSKPDSGNIRVNRGFPDSRARRESGSGTPDTNRGRIGGKVPVPDSLRYAGAHAREPGNGWTDAKGKVIEGMLA